MFEDIILKTEQHLIFVDPNWTFFWIFVVGISILGFLSFVFAFKNLFLKKMNMLLTSLGCTVMMSLIICVLGYFIATVPYVGTPHYENYYHVEAEKFYVYEERDEYEIVRQEDKILVVREKTD